MFGQWRIVSEFTRAYVFLRSKRVVSFVLKRIILSIEKLVSCGGILCFATLGHWMYWVNPRRNTTCWKSCFFEVCSRPRCSIASENVFRRNNRSKSIDNGRNIFSPTAFPVYAGWDSQVWLNLCRFNFAHAGCKPWWTIRVSWSLPFSAFKQRTPN